MLTGKGVIGAEQKAILAAFSRTPDADRFYLTGGTALAEFFLGHRRSYDLDLFTVDEGLVLPFSYQLESSLTKGGITTLPIRRLNSFAEFTCVYEERETRLHLAYDTPFRFASPEKSEYGVLVNDYGDLVVDKLLAFYGRYTHRDAIDLYFILQREDPGDLSRKAKRKDPGFDLYWLAVALKQVEAFPDRIEDWDVEMTAPISALTIKMSLAALAEDCLRGALS